MRKGRVRKERWLLHKHKNKNKNKPNQTKSNITDQCVRKIPSSLHAASPHNPLLHMYYIPPCSVQLIPCTPPPSIDGKEEREMAITTDENLYINQINFKGRCPPLLNLFIQLISCTPPPSIDGKGGREDGYYHRRKRPPLFIQHQSHFHPSSIRTTSSLRPAYFPHSPPFIDGERGKRGKKDGYYHKNTNQIQQINV